ncbi:MAG: UDP-N-acetylmuramoyl-tripeptide--D-alanyl-D-alanine ligase, partial [Treponema sp.]|nr:UDP-N-acetylmuramoyl-tripeptide--D-alanyl-D-alanine ligase [Treponema sp.]
MTVEELTQATGGSCPGNFAPDSGCGSVVTDSRSVIEGALFVPLMGENQDGHRFIPEALDSGARVVFVDAAHGEGSANMFSLLAKQHGAAIIMVENTLTALQDAAKAYVRKFPGLRRVAITGSSGKTTTKELTAAIFSRKYRVVANAGNLNSETGLPLSVFRIRDEHEVGIFELGMNRRGEMREIAEV